MTRHQSYKCYHGLFAAYARREPTLRKGMFSRGRATIRAEKAVNHLREHFASYISRARINGPV